MSRRTEKVDALLQKEVGEFLNKMELAALTTISKVEVTPDLRLAKIWVTILADPKIQAVVFEDLTHSLHELQKSLNNKLKMRYVPRISFVIDHSEEYSSHIESLLKKIKGE
jgi:ribosome-binding factor A